MNTFRAYIKKVFKTYDKHGGKLAEAETLRGWEAFTSIIAGIYLNQGLNGERAR